MATILFLQCLSSIVAKSTAAQMIKMVSFSSFSSFNTNIEIKLNICLYFSCPLVCISLFHLFVFLSSTCLYFSCPLVCTSLVHLHLLGCRLLTPPKLNHVVLPYEGQYPPRETSKGGENHIVGGENHSEENHIVENHIEGNHMVANQICLHLTISYFSPCFNSSHLFSVLNWIEFVKIWLDGLEC